MKIIAIAQIIVSVLLIISILLQNRETGLGIAFGGGGSSFYAKRGLEKFIFKSSIILATLFVLLALVNIIYMSRV